MEQKEFRLAAIMFTHIVGFSRIIGKDEAGAFKLLDFHNQLVQQQVSAHGGRIIKTPVDAIQAEFPNATNAVKCAIAIQGDLELRNADPLAKPLVLRIGVHVGDIYFLAEDAVGEGITVADHLRSLCKPGRICISDEVHSIVSGKIDVNVRPLGSFTIYDINRPLTAWEILTYGSAYAVENLSETGRRHDEHVKPVSGPKRSAKVDSGSLNQNYEQYRTDHERRVTQETAGFRSHLITFVAVNVFLWSIWLSTSDQGFMWPLIVNLGWGIGLVSHLARLRHRARTVSSFKLLPALDQKQTGLLRMLFVQRQNWVINLTNTVAIGIFLAVLNILVSPFLPWALFPIVGMAIWLFTQWPLFKSREQDLLVQLNRDGVSILPSRLRGVPQKGKAADQLSPQGPASNSSYVSPLPPLKPNSSIGDDPEPGRRTSPDAAS